LQVPRSLLAFVADQLRTGPASGVLGNNFTIEEAAAIIDYTLDRLFQSAEVRRGARRRAARAADSAPRRPA
jgi:hypothetical protein